MLGRVLRGALAGTSQSIALCEQLLPARYLSMSATGSSCALPTGIETSGGLPLQENSGDLAAASSAEASDACRAASHGLASTSLRCLATRENHSFPDGWGALCSQGLAASGLQLQQRRGYGYQPPKPRFPLPDSIASIVEEKTREHRRSAPAPPPAPKLEPRPMTPTSLRTGCIATKAGMTQEWDEHGVRVPLTVLWVDECQVVGLKTRPVHGYNALMLGSGYKRQKCMSPSEAGFFLKAGVPFKKLVAEWQVSEDALVPVGTAIGAAHYVAGQRVDVTGWTKWKGFQGVMRRWGFKGLPASHGVSLSHRAPGSIGNRQDPGKIWKGKKLPGCMGDERRTVHNCLVYKVDAARNLVYLRGQVPGPVGRSVFLRDSRLASPALRASWGLPFPTHVPSAEELKAAPAPGDVSVVPAPDGPGVTAWRNPTDPYLMYREETDYMPVKWKKGE